LIVRWIESFVVMMSPITPHLCQHLWTMIGKTGDAGRQSWPVAGNVDKLLQRQITYLRETAANFRVALLRQKEKLAKQAAKAAKKPAAANGDAAAAAPTEGGEQAKKGGKQAKGGKPAAAPAAGGDAASASTPAPEQAKVSGKGGKGGKGATAAAPSTGETKSAPTSSAVAGITGSVIGTTVALPVTQPWLRIGFEPSDATKSPTDPEFVNVIRVQYADVLARQGRVVSPAAILVDAVSPEPRRPFKTVADFIAIGGIYNITVDPTSSTSSSSSSGVAGLTAAELDAKLAAFKAEILQAIAASSRK
jgi:leucyl-tRNA synthetase